jgi:molybdopterin-dependent oxidoreductase alpha subunit
VRIGGDAAFLAAAQKVLIARGAVASEFVAAATEGYADFARALDAQRMDELLALCGLPLAEVEAFADEVAAADKGILVWSMGITQHAGGGDSVRAIANLALLREWVGRPGTGLMPIRGHSGVQGGAEMGCYATALPGGLPVDAENARRFEALWGFPVPSKPGRTTVEVLDAALAGDVDGLYCIGGNFLETMPQPERIERALERIPVRIHSDIVVTSQMLAEPADVVYLLPARTRYEQRGGGTETTTERRVVFSPYVPGHDVGETQSEWEMLLEFARAVKPEGAGRIHFEDGAAIRAEIEAAVPAYRGIAALAQQGDQFQWGGERLCEGRKFPTVDGKAHFVPVRPMDRVPGEGKFLLATRRGKQFNSMVQRERDPLTGAERDHVFVSQADAERLGLATGDAVVVRSEVGEMKGRAFVADVAPGTLQAHWPEANGLIPPGRIDPDGGVPDYNAEVTLARG